MIFRVIMALEESQLRESLRKDLGKRDCLFKFVDHRDRLLPALSGESCDLVILSEALLPGPAEDTVRLLDNLPEPPAVVMIIQEEAPEKQAALLAAGCDVVLYASLPGPEIAEALYSLLRKHGEGRRGQPSRRPALSDPSLSDFVSASPAMRAFMNTVQRVARSDSSLLIQGETGVGKERLARAIHGEGPRGHGPFIAINCAALPENLLESELFGHEQGAFTGATRARRGAFELAHGGTIFLDEVGDMPLHLQGKLLRVLQEREFQRVGGEKPIRVNVRVMAATNRDLRVEVEARRFRGDLFYRIGVVTLTIPPLAARKEDIPELVSSYIGYLAPRIGSTVDGIVEDALQALVEYSWPGNVRELINVIERAMLLCEGEDITLRDLPEEISRIAGARPAPPLLASNSDQFPEEWLELPWRQVRELVLERCERTYLAALLNRCSGRVGETAEKAGMEARSLYDKMKRYNLRKEDFRRAAKNCRPDAADLPAESDLLPEEIAAPQAEDFAPGH